MLIRLLRTAGRTPRRSEDVVRSRFSAMRDSGCTRERRGPQLAMPLVVSPYVSLALCRCSQADGDVLEPQLFGGSAFTKEYVFGLEDYRSASWYQNFVASIAGSVSSIVVSQPLDVIKVSLRPRPLASRC